MCIILYMNLLILLTNADAENTFKKKTAFTKEEGVGWNQFCQNQVCTDGSCSGKLHKSHKGDSSYTYPTARFK